MSRKLNWIPVLAVAALLAFVVGCSKAPESKEKVGDSSTTSQVGEQKPEVVEDLVPEVPRRPGERDAAPGSNLPKSDEKAETKPVDTPKDAK